MLLAKRGVYSKKYFYFLIKDFCVVYGSFDIADISYSVREHNKA